MPKPQASVIIPVRTATAYLKETIGYLQKQTFKDFELIVVTDKKEKIAGAKVVSSGDPGPAFKRNLGAGKAKGEILAFLDDDSYPSHDWLKNAIGVFGELREIRRKEIAAVCGPCLTPAGDNLYQKVTGWVWKSWLGSAGAGAYRNRICPRREVDDFPSVNLLVRKRDFKRIGGFDIQHWPGEDTELCLSLTKKLGKKIIYDPQVLVYHHRRPVFLPHLKQVGRYAVRRGFFAKKFPETSFRLGYLMPSLFIFGLFFGAFFSLAFPLIRNFYLTIVGLYLVLLVLSGVEAWVEEKNLILGILLMIAIFTTHLWYGFLFPVGFTQKDLGVIPRKVDREKKEYVGG